MRIDPLFANQVAADVSRRTVPADKYQRRLTSAATPSERGVALVITLILLSVILFMTVTFLVVSQAQRNSVQTDTEQMVAKQAANAASDRAMADLMASVLAYSNAFGYDLRVSTNYINPNGFITGNTSATNVSYNYPNGNPLNAADALQNLANQLYDPRPPVYVTTNLAGAKDFRYYLDLNRNGRYDTNGWQPVMNPNGGFYNTNGQPIPNIIPGNTLSNFFVGDPEWIGLLERPGFPPGLMPPGFGFRRGFPHSATNKYGSRYAYIVVPVGKTLDINYIHDYAKLLRPTMPDSSGDGFLRNQGVGTWEVNLASFLADLNTNQWDSPVSPYVYRWMNNASQDYLKANSGAAFDNALALIRYRYGGDWVKSVPSVLALYNNNGENRFLGDGIDGYSAGPVMTASWRPAPDPDGGPPLKTRLAWAGGYNTNHYFTTQELFDKNKLNWGNQPPVPPGVLTFADRLAIAGTNNSSYDRYTFYRLLSQLGTDSEPESGKINLNYRNVDDSGAIVPSMATNFLPWEPIRFFTNTANKLLANAGYTLKSSGIQIYPTNYYTANVHRMFQLAANIYDSTTNRTYNRATNGFPTLFRPLFGHDPGNPNVILITNFVEVATAADVTSLLTATANMRDLQVPKQRQGLAANDMVYGVPLVIGARQGFPNFNEFSMQTLIYVSRMLEFRRSGAATTSPVDQTNQMYVAAITNVYGVEAWNSYSNPYPRNLQLITYVDMTATVTNEVGTLLLNNQVSRVGNMVIAPGTWNGWVDAGMADASFKIPFGQLTNNLQFLTNSTYKQSTKSFWPLTHIFEQNTGFDTPVWMLNLRSRVRFVLLDTEANRIVDYVNLDNTEPTLDIMATLRRDANCRSVTPSTYNDIGSQWCTNRNLGNPLGPTYGILNQIGVCLNGTTDWKSFVFDPVAGLDPESAVDGFRFNLADLSPMYPKDQDKVFNKSNIFYAPFAPFRPIFVRTKWQANDPLVHYAIGDLMDLSVPDTNRVSFDTDQPTPLNNLGVINPRYRPWGGNPSKVPGAIADYDPGAKDPLVTRSDAWEFQTNKFPNVGWLGRVHRGTPWQTVNLKATNIVDLAAWRKWTGNNLTMTNGGQFDTNVVPYNVLTNDAAFTLPSTDRHILDLFTTAFNENATRGQMSVNQDGLAAWSAVLGGVIVVTNTATNSFSDIRPAGIYDPADKTALPPIVRIVQGINRTRNNFPNHEFQRLGDILATPELSLGPQPVFVNNPAPGYWTNASPFLGKDTTTLSDSVYERMPQQVLGLLKGGEQPRFVIYAYGQSLKPAEKSVVLSGPYSGMVTNYQITAEVATRTVVRIEGAPTNTHAVIESYNVLPAD